MKLSASSLFILFTHEMDKLFQSKYFHAQNFSQHNIMKEEKTYFLQLGTFLCETTRAGMKIRIWVDTKGSGMNTQSSSHEKSK